MTDVEERTREYLKSLDDVKDKLTPLVQAGKKVIRCPNCGSEHTTGHGYNMTKKGRFPRRKCQGCGTTFYSDRQEVDK